MRGRRRRTPLTHSLPARATEPCKMPVKEAEMSAEWTAAIASAASAVLLPAALLFAGLQWRETARQTDRAASAADAAVYQSIAQQFFEINRMFVERPELHAYFYDGMPTPQEKS